MAEIIGKEELENSDDPQSKKFEMENSENYLLTNSSEENSPTLDTSNTLIQDETKNMEVHHHAHHGHEKKTWKNYFWEFFMLFLAVFSGFLAEIQVEHYVEHQREKKYMQMCLIDLRADSLRFYRIISSNQERIVKIDQLITLLNKKEINDSTIEALYDLNSKAIRSYSFLFNTRTLSQLKTAGGYKLIRVKIVADSLIIRDSDVDWNDMMRQRLFESAVHVREVGSNIFDEYQLYSYRKSLAINPNNQVDSALKSISPIQKMEGRRFSLLTNDKKEISKFSTSVIYFQLLLNHYNSDLKSYQRKCNSLIKLIKDEYNLT